jgi:hypothetical protein
MDCVVILDLWEQPDLLDLLDPLAQFPDPEVLLDNRDRLDLLEHLAQFLGLRDRLDLRDKMELREHLVNKDVLELVTFLDHRDPLELRERQEHRERQEQLDPKGLLDQLRMEFSPHYIQTLKLLLLQKITRGWSLPLAERCLK